MDLTHIIAGGGIIAGITMVWNHLKSIYTQVSGLILARAEIDSGDLIIKTVNYLNAHYYQPKKVKQYFSSVVYRKTASFEYIDVPYEIKTIQGINYKKGKLLFVYSKGNTLHITTIRGTVNFKNFLIEVIKNAEKRKANTKFNTRGDKFRFQIIDIVGSEINYGQPVSLSKSPSERGDKEIEENADYLFKLSRLYSLKNYSFYYDPSEYASVEEDHFSNLFLEPKVLEFIEQAKKWDNHREWYRERMIPWRRGVLLHGPGGTGKSSLSLAIAKTFQYPLYRFYLNTLSDQEFLNAWKDLSLPAVILIEISILFIMAEHPFQKENTFLLIAY